MRVDIAWGHQHAELEVLDKNLVPFHRAAIAAPLVDPVRVMRDALQNPLDYPPLWRALTPDDHIAVAVDEGMPRFAELLVVLLEHVSQAGVQPDAVTLLCMPPSSGQPWIDDLADEFQDVRIEVHQPADRRKLAYLATTKQGHRVYLNRTAVDADQLVVLTRRGYDPLVGYAGAESAMYPGLGDEETFQELCTKVHHRVPGISPRSPGGEGLGVRGASDDQPWPVQQKAKEVAWLLGVPFFVQVIEGSGDSIDKIIAGPLDSSVAGERLLNARWRISVDQPADVVVASITGSPARLGIDDLARAFFAASRVVKTNGCIVLLTDLAPPLGRGFEIFRQHEDPSLALRMLNQEKTSDLPGGFMWATAANQARLYLLSGLANDVAEELFTVPLQNPQQVQKLLTDQATCLFLPDAHKSLAVLSP